MPGRSARRVDLLALGTLSGLACAASGASPTGRTGTDVVLTFAVGFLAAFGAGTARRIGLTVAGAGAFLASLLGSSFATQLAGAVGVAAMVPGWQHGRLAGAARATSGAAAVNVVLRLEWDVFHGASALAAGAVLATLAWAHFGAQVRKRRRRLTTATFVVAGVTGLFSLLAVGNGFLARSDVTRAVRDLRHGIEALRAVDDEEAVSEFESAARHFDRAQRSIGAPWAKLGTLVPVVSQNVEAVDRLVEAGHRLARTAARSSASARVGSIRAEEGAVDVEALAALEAPLSDALDALASAARATEEADSPWLLPPIRGEVDRLRGRVTEALPDAEHALAAARVAPALLGRDAPRRYFIAFVTPAEARGSGGLVGNYGELTIDQGQLELSEFGRVRELNPTNRANSGRRLGGPDDYVARYARFDIENYFQDVTFSPDFPSVAAVIDDLYPQATGREIDGVISVDPIGLSALLELTGPVRIPELSGRLTSENATDVLLRDQYVEFAEDNPDRIDFLESAAQSVFERLTTGSLPGPRRLADVLGPATRGGHLKLYSADADEQAFFERIGASGQYPGVEGDFIGVVTQNASRSKIDVFLRRSIDYAATVDPTGRTDAVVEVRLRNDAPSDGLPAYVIGGGVSDPGVNRMYLSVYSPLELVDASFDGRSLGMETAVELGRNVYSQYIEVPPGSTKTVRLELSGDVPLGDPDRPTYRLGIGRQPLVDPDRVTVHAVTTGGEPLVEEEFRLDQHAELTAPLP